MSESTVVAGVVAPLVNNNEPQAQVIELLVANGDVVAEGDLLCVLETSKTTADVEAPAAGHVGRLRLREGDMVDAGAPICDIFDGPPPEEAAAAAADGAAPRLTRKAEAMAREAGISDLSSLPTDRFITQRDIEELIARRAAAAPVELAPGLVASIGPRSIVVFGGGGLGRCVIEMIRAAGAGDVLGVIDDGLAPGDDVLGAPVLGGQAMLAALAGAGLTRAAHAVGGIGRMSSRVRVAGLIEAAGLAMPAIVDPSATVSPSATLGDGAQVHVGARVMARARIGRNALINTGAVISHDCVIGDHSHIAPGAILAGDVTVGAGTLVGMGVTALLGVSVGADCVIGNGAHLLADVPDGIRVGVGQVWTGQG
ncbi:MAG: biotin/lipoyl-containing protein [Thermoleophilia bacterium]